jgi:hypothetical protein
LLNFSYAKVDLNVNGFMKLEKIAKEKKKIKPIAFFLLTCLPHLLLCKAINEPHGALLTRYFEIKLEADIVLKHRPRLKILIDFSYTILAIFLQKKFELANYH